MSEKVAESVKRNAPRLRLTLPQIFCIVGFVQAAVVIGLYSYVFAQWQQYMGPNSFQVPSNYVVPTNLAIILFAFVYECLLICDAIYNQNSVQVTAVCFINAGLVVTTALSRLQLKNAIYSMADARDANGQPLVHLDQDIWGNVRGIMIASPIILGIGTALLFAILFKLLKHFSWIKYQHLNGDLIMRRRYLVYQGFLALLKIDFFMVIAFLTIYAVNVLSWRGWEFYATIAFAIGMILIPLLAAYLVRRESVPGMLVILTLFSAAIAYFVFKLHLMYAPSKTHYLYEATLTISTSYACLSIFFLSLTVACGVVCMLNFGHGLRGYLVNEHQEVGEEVADVHYGVGLRGGPQGVNLGDSYISLAPRDRMSRRLSLD